MKGNAEWILGANAALLLLFLLVGCLCIPVEEKLGGNEAVAERSDHKGSSHEEVSSFLDVRQS